jgi:hypothetical protein
LNFSLHARVIFTGRAVIVVITILERNNTRLHPDTRMLRAGVLIRFNLPDLPPENSADLRALT